MRLHGFDIGKWIGKAHCAPRYRSGYIEKRYVESSAATLVRARLAGEGGDEFLASGVVLHRSGIGFGVGQNFSGSVDDGGAGAGGKTFLSGNFQQGVGAIGFDAMGEQESLLGKVALNFGAERGFPCAAQHHVENGGSGCDHNHKNGEEFEENAVLHVLVVRLGTRFTWGTLIWETRSGSRPRARF